MNESIVSCFENALKSGASDLFLTAGKKPSLRIRGKIRPVPDAPVIPAESLEQFRRDLCGEPGERIYAENGSFDLSWSNPLKHRFRVNFYQTVHGPAMAVRPLCSGNDIYAEDLHLPDLTETLCDEPRGLILVTGSTGSGKSTTLAAMINHVNRTAEKHILTIEDPIEFLHEDIRSLISQREIHSDSSSFAEALRAALRENPDVIVIGEIRDPQTMQTALNAALTGHLVIGTLHTSDTIQAVERVITMFPEEQREQAAIDFGSAVTGIFAQRLIPEINGTGMYPAMEILPGTPTVRKLITDRDYAGLDEVLKQGGAGGMISFNRSVFRLYQKKIISLEDARQAVSSRDEFDLLVKGMESGVAAFRNHYGDGYEDPSMVDMRSLLRSAMRNKASDLILTVGARPTIRLNGDLSSFDLPELSERDVQKLLYGIISRRQRIELEEKRELDLALSVTFHQKDGSDTVSRFRINAFFQRGFLGVVARVVNQKIPEPSELHLPEAVVGFTDKKQGLILITGPTGSGKSTTLASLLDRINRNRAAHVITIEDPIEYVHENRKSIVEQRELHSDTFSFATALKYALRQNPDVIMIGEMRDVETMAAALTAAETGHLVLATIHTNSAPQTIDRIVDSFPVSHQNQIRVQLAGVLLGVVSQRLLPRKDHAGRIAAFEIMAGTPPVQALIRDGKTFQLQSVMETSAKDGMMTLEKSMNLLMEQNLIEREEAQKFHADYKIPDCEV